MRAPSSGGAPRMWRAALLLLVALWLVFAAMTLLVLAAAMFPDGAVREALRPFEPLLPDPATFPP